MKNLICGWLFDRLSGFMPIDDLTILLNLTLFLFHYAAIFFSGPEKQRKKLYFETKENTGSEWLTTSQAKEEKKRRENVQKYKVFLVWMAVVGEKAKNEETK